MNLANIAAILALASIPVNVLIARWQARTAIQQAEAANSAALKVAEQNHQASLDALHKQAEADRAKWLAECRRAECRTFQLALSQFRHALLAQDLILEDLRDTYSSIHDGYHALGELGPGNVAGAAMVLRLACEEILKAVTLDELTSLGERSELWRTHAVSRRQALTAPSEMPTSTAGSSNRVPP